MTIEMWRSMGGRNVGGRNVGGRNVGGRNVAVECGGRWANNVLRLPGESI